MTGSSRSKYNNDRELTFKIPTVNAFAHLASDFREGGAGLISNLHPILNV
jgi:hypothetical protein